MAPFFAGRESEIAAFDVAARQAQAKPNAVFRIYQGPPGCGKTSLVQHLKKIRSDDAVFVTLNPSTMRTVEDVLDRIVSVSVEHGGIAARAGGVLADALARRFQADAAGDAAKSAIAARARGKRTLVLHLEEAHARAHQAADVLLSLHADGMDVPCVMLMTGLPATRAEVASIGGLSRLSIDATTDMSAMTHDECRDSTLLMLDALGVEEHHGDRQSLAGLTARAACCWPQHLHIAQAALCNELLRCNGDPNRVDRSAIETETAQGRNAYYAARLEYPPLMVDRPTTLRILARVQREKNVGRRAFVDLVNEELAPEADLFAEEGVSAKAVRDVLLETGILVVDQAGGISVAIPSMATWAERQSRSESAA